MKTTSKKLWFSLTVTRADGVGVLPILSPRLLPRPRVRPAAPEVSLIGIGVRFLPAPRRRREHRAEHAQIEFPEPGPLLEAPRAQDDRREEDAEVREVEHDALGRVAPDVLLVAHRCSLQAVFRFFRGPRASSRCDGVALVRRIHCAAL